MNKAIIKIKGLKKSYGEAEAVSGISFEIKEGEMFGLVGPDGAGKTTTIRILCGLLGFGSGEVKIFQKDILSNRKEIQNNIGYLSQKFSLYGDLSVDENIEFFADIHGVKNYQQRRDELLEFTRLMPFRKREAEKLSGGMKQKLALACSLIHRPKILFLDEPTTGVDPVSRRDFWKILSGLLKEGITIIITTPYLDEAERCNRVALMNEGKIISLDEPANMKKSIKKDVIEIVTASVRSAFKAVNESLGFEVQMFGDRINIVVENAKHELEKILFMLKEKSIEVESHRIIPPSLENVFIYLIKK